MANKNLFPSATIVKPTVKNAAGGVAYKSSAHQALAQYACVGTFNGTFYTDATSHLNEVKKLVSELKDDPEFIAKVAVYSRQKSYMKDMPAFLCAVLACQGQPALFRKVFDQVIDNGKMLRNFMQIGRSGQAGKVLNMSSGAVRHAIRDWFSRKDSGFIFRASIGNDPSMRDMLRMSHPKPSSDEKAALFAYLKGASYDAETDSYLTFNKDGSVKYSQPFSNLPEIVQEFEVFKREHQAKGVNSLNIPNPDRKVLTVPNVDFRMLDSILTKEEAEDLWKNQAKFGSWQTTRMNLNNFVKYGVFSDAELIDVVAKRLSSKEEVLKARVFPYQIMTAYMNATSIPHKVKEALQDAMEHAIDNVPEIDGQVYVLVDVSYSMSSSVTGYRPGASSVVRCVDVAGLFASSILRRNRSARVIPFAGDVKSIALNGRDTVLTNAGRLSGLLGGGTNCSKPLKKLNDEGAMGNTVIYVSDNESWMDSPATFNSGNQKTATQQEWDRYKGRNPQAKLVCIDITPRDNAQVRERKDILQVGGFSDEVFNVIDSFLSDKNSESNYWVSKINEVTL